ncbi:MAG TPA: aminotransferase class III-fold pyridoxal phosphate-dependent enzyme [Xanthobacteraceae bacterium]|nr:aminotransferase class III-fold pyridoxal phosphate-dependent enzyme [Xanthobacteraceae bacterium]
MPALYARHATDCYDLYGRHSNEQMVRMLRTVGLDVDFCRGEGQYLYDRSGTRYLDLLAGFGVFAIGRNHPTLQTALRSVLDSKLPNLIQMDAPRLAAVLAQRLLQHVPYLQKAFFANSGAEAVDAALKFARASTGRVGIVYCDHAFHGVTYGALSVNGDETFRGGFGPFLPGCARIPFNDLAALDRALGGGDVAAFIVEPIQGKGVNVAAADYLQGAAELCRRHGTVLIADEIQTGLGRTGRFLAVEHFNVEPDIVLLSKALSGGYVPVSAVLMRKRIFDKVFDRMDRAMAAVSTFAENNLAMAAGIATLEVIAGEKLVERAASMGERLLREFSAMSSRYELMHEARGKGLMIAIDFARPQSRALRAEWDLIEKAREGLFGQVITIPLFTEHKILSQVAGPNSHAVKFLPPLIITESDCDWIVKSVEAVLAASHRVPGAAWSLGKTLIANFVRA